MTLKERALSMGFYRAEEISPSLLRCTKELRELCKNCKAYSSCWLCPPNCPDIEAMQKKIDSFKNALVVVSRYSPADPFDEKLTLSLGRGHALRVLKLAESLPKRYVLTAGNCQICEKCTCPDAPCRHEELSLGSISAHGINITDVCMKAGIPCEFKKDEVSFIGIVLW